MIINYHETNMSNNTKRRGAGGEVEVVVMVKGVGGSGVCMDYVMYK